MAQSQKAIDGGRIPGPASVPNTVEIAVVYTIGTGKTIKNFFHGNYVSTPPNLQTVASALFTSLGSAFTSNLAAQMHPSTSMVRVEVRDMASPLNPIYIGTGTALPGTGTGNPLPAEMAAVMTKNVAARGRGAKGRVYLTGWAAGAGSTTGTIAAAVVSAINSYGTAVMNALNAQSLPAVVAKPARQQYTGLTGTTHPSRGATNIAVSTMTCRDSNWDSNRRRGYK